MIMALVFRDDPYPAYNFEIVVTGISDDGRASRGSFSEVSGIETDMPPIEYRNGSEDTTVRKIPGLKKFGPVTLKRGVLGDLTFWNWILAGMNGQVKRTEAAIILFDEQRSEVMRWNLKRVWPSKWTGPGLNAKNNEIAMETLELCHEGLSTDGER
jgi:phage tail-like protein